MVFNGSRLEKRRAAAGLSRHDIVVEFIRRGSSVTERTIIRWESGENEPRANALADLADILGCSVQDFFGERAA